MTKQKILLIDANNMFYRAYTANPSLNLDGQHVGAISGFLYSLQKSVKDTRPHQIFIIWDGQGGSKKRKEIRVDYKHGRKPPKPIKLNRALDVQLTEEEEKQSRWYQHGRIIEVLNHLPVIQLCESGVEADDFISFLNNKFNCESNLKIIVSNDRDFIQLLNNCTILYRPAKTEFITLKTVVNELGVHPANMALARAIEGDKADNLSGVPGVGIKRLTKLIPEFANETQMTFDMLKEFCNSRYKEKKLTKKQKEQNLVLEDTSINTAIIDNMNVIEQNYQIMQLYAPLIPPHAAQSVNEQIKNFKPYLSIDNFQKELKRDGIFGSSYNELIQHCSVIVENLK